MTERSEKHPLRVKLAAVLLAAAVGACVEGGGPTGSVDTSLVGADLTQPPGDQLDPSDKSGGDAQADDAMVSDTSGVDGKTSDAEGPPIDSTDVDSGDAGPEAGEFLYPWRRIKIATPATV